MFDPYHKWLGIAKEQRPPTHYQLLAISPTESDPEVIEEAAVRQSAHVRTYQIGQHAAECTRLLNEIAQAKLVLLNPAKRQAYDASLAKTRTEQFTAKAPAASPFATAEPAEEFGVTGAVPMINSRMTERSIAKPSKSNATLVWGLVGAGVVGAAVVAVVVITMTSHSGEINPNVEAALKKDGRPKDKMEKFSDKKKPLGGGDKPAPVDPGVVKPVEKKPTEGAAAAIRKNPGATLVPDALPQPPSPVDVAGKKTIDLIALIDPVQDAVHGKWAIADGVLHCNDGHFVPRIEIPYQPPEEYDLTVVFSQPELRNGVSLIMPRPDGDSFFWHLGSVKGSRYGFFTKEDQREALPGLISRNQAHTTTVQVRRDRLRGIVDGKVLVDRKADFGDMTCDRWRTIRDKSVLAVACDDPTVFHFVRLVEISGSGKKMR